jgi:aminoglycoside phosphotransferase (APT) family kinase protein
MKLIKSRVNIIHKDQSHIIKIYTNDHYMPKHSSYRLEREKNALKKFPNIAPAFIKEEDNKLFMQYIKGETLESIVTKSTYPYYSQKAGEILSQIHQPVKMPFHLFQRNIERQIIADRKILAPLLEKEYINPQCYIDWDEVEKFGLSYVHRDFHFGNIIQSKERFYVIDWESAGYGSPYEDFASIEFWLFRIYGEEPNFFAGYGRTPKDSVIRSFVKMKLLQQLARLVSRRYQETALSKFYINTFIEGLHTYEI